MEDGNVVNIKEEKHVTIPIKNLYANHSTTFTANGHGFHGEASGRRLSSNIDISSEDKTKKRINPLKIHLGKRPYIDDSLQYYSNSKKKAYVNKACDIISKNLGPQVTPKLVPKKFDRNICHNVTPRVSNHDICEDDVPVPRLLPKGQLLSFKKGKTEEGPQLKEYAHSLGLQPMVKFKCRRCCSMSFETLKMLKKHQMVCRAQAREPISTTETPTTTETRLGEPSRVTRKVYLCSACGTCYENWNLFLHMREVHNRHICLFCLGMFSKAKRLSSHLISKHNIKEFAYESKEDFLNVYSGTLFLMCCSCEEICSEQDDIFNHDCNNVKPKPVPVLISKNASKVSANMKPMSNKNNESMLTNGPLAACLKDLNKEVNDNVSYDKMNIERKPETVISSYNCVAQTEEEIVRKHTDAASNSAPSSKSSLISTYPCETKTDDSNLDDTKIISPIEDHIETLKDEKPPIINGDDSSYVEPETCEPIPIDRESPVSPVKEENSVIQDKEKDCGIKLKLSLNNAKSPVIINSTVDPSVGKQNLNKPPTRIRRPPKRYEKETSIEDPQQQLSTPIIKMTICEKADSSFVKSTIIAKELDCIKKSVNSNMEDEMSSTISQDKKYDNTVKTTIYDNKPDEINSLNRVPKLTVRVPKELLDRDSSSDYSSDSDLSDKLTVDENNIPEKNKDQTDQNQQEDSVVVPHEQIQPSSDCVLVEKEKWENDQEIYKTEEELESLPKHENVTAETESACIDNPEEPATAEEVPAVELTLNRPLDKYPLKELLKVFLNSTVYNCIYCNHVRKIAVNCEQLALHMVAQHRFSATVDSITAEELLPETITAKVKTGAEELRSVFINLDSYDSEEKYEHFQYDHLFECFQCYFKTAIHKDLYLHNRKMHQKTILLCVMCKGNFYSYSELLCHLCPGTYDPDHEIKFRCCLCSIDSIPSSFRLMVHLRKIHHACDVCLEFCHNQTRLSNHVWKHKLHHLCYRCGIAYRNKPDITKHLFWKHGTESVMCKKCLQKKWPHVYHFCMPPLSFICDECNLHFTKAVYLKVHKRFHTKEFPHCCQEEGCAEKFVSKKLLLKHLDTHKEIIHNENPVDEEQKPIDEEIVKDESKTPIIDLIDEKQNTVIEHKEGNNNIDTENLSKKTKKKKSKDKDNLLLDVNLPVLNLSESDSSDESDNEALSLKEEKTEIKSEKEEKSVSQDMNFSLSKVEEKLEGILDEKSDEQKVLDIWDNFKRYQAKVEKQKTPPLVPIRKHVCESDHDYCLIPSDLNGDDRPVSPSKKDKKSVKKKLGDLSTSSSSSSDSDSSCSCGSNCSCSSSSDSSSSSSSDSDSSDSGREKKKKIIKKKNINRRNSCGSQASAVDVMGMAETPVLVPEVREPPIAETDLETDETDTDEEFYDENPQKLTSAQHTEKRNQLMVLATPAPSDNGSISGDVSRCTTPIRDEEVPKKEKVLSSKKKSKKKRRTKNLKKTEPLKINIPKEIISKLEPELPVVNPSLIPNKITISLQSNTIQIPEIPQTASTTLNISTSAKSAENKRASKRRRIPNKFYGYSSEEDTPQIALKPQQPPKLEWRKEDLPSPPLSHKAKKEVPSSTIPQKFHNYSEPIRLKTPIPDPVPPPILMNSESMGSSDSDSSEEGALQIYQPSGPQSSIPAPPAHITSGTSSLPYPFQRPAVRQAREGESVYCYCRCPYDEVSEMIACDAEGCAIEWFHFECVGIMVPPKGKWYCPDCRQKQNFSAYR